MLFKYNNSKDCNRFEIYIQQTFEILYYIPMRLEP